jgi:hypothetical protein
MVWRGVLKADSSLLASCGAGEQAAEIGADGNKTAEQAIAGAEAPGRYCGSCGTTKQAAEKGPNPKPTLD